MFQEMINGSVAVFTKPSVGTFEEHEKNNLSWALIYSVIAGVINAILVTIQGLLFRPTIPADMPPEFAAAAQPNLGANIAGGIFGTIIGLLIYWGITYALGRAFGGTGQFGELAYDLALFNAPSTVIFSLLNFIPFLGGIAGLALWIYNLYLTYLAIQSGMNLPSNKALYVIIIEIVIAVAIVLCFVLFFAAVIAAIIGGSGGFAP
jgi:hypothetical protein